jgi:hypothetical protein
MSIFDSRSDRGSIRSRDIMGRTEFRSPPPISQVSSVSNMSVTSDSPDFELLFENLGSGRANILPTRGEVVPTFTRATTATTVGSTGLIVSVASGVPRSYYDPTTLQYLGYLPEGARTNLCLQSEDLGTSWLNVRTTNSLNTTTAPDGASTADKLIEDATAANSHLISTPSWTSTLATYTFSVFAKANTRTRLQLGVSSSHITGTGANGTFNLGAGTAAVVNDCTVAIQPFANSWFRCSITFTCTASAAASSFIYLLDAAGAATYNGDGSSGLFIWGAQIELGAFAASYIPTTTVSVTRNADVLTYPLTGWFNAVAGSLFVQATAPSADLSFARVVSIDDGTANEYISWQNNVASGRPFVVDGGATQFTNTTAWTNGTTAKMALAYAVNDFASSFNGGVPGTDALGTLPTVTAIGVGCISNGAAQFFGPISRIGYFSQRKTGTELQALTA